jgi:hypothetical protein
VTRFPASRRRHRPHRRRIPGNRIQQEERPTAERRGTRRRLRHATLVIAKLDRLARNVHFISSPMESRVDFVACDNPHATRLTIHILVSSSSTSAR